MEKNNLKEWLKMFTLFQLILSEMIIVSIVSIGGGIYLNVKYHVPLVICLFLGLTGLGFIFYRIYTWNKKYNELNKTKK